MEEAHWKQIYGNRYLKRLEPPMLLPDGYRVMQNVRVVGETGNPKMWRYVLYDREYALLKACMEIVKPLNFRDYQSFIEFCREIWQVINVISEDDSNHIQDNSLKPKINLKEFKSHVLHGQKVFNAEKLIDFLKRQGFEIIWQASDGTEI